MPVVKTKLESPGRQIMPPRAVVGDSEALVANGGACRVIMKGTGGADGTFQVYGTDLQPDEAAAEDWYPLGPSVVFVSDGSRTLFIDEANTTIRVSLVTANAGTFSAKVQREM